MRKNTKPVLLPACQSGTFAGATMKVVMVVQDSLPNRCVGADTTPELWRLINNGGGWCRAGGCSVLASSTYPNHASFVTGADVQQHRIFTNKIWNGREFVCASTTGPAIETIFDVVNAGGLSTAAVLGDFTMVGVTGAQRAGAHWPVSAQHPPNMAKDSLGYAANAAVVEQVDKLDALQADLCVIHINEPDSALHVWGPGTTEVREQILRCDQTLADIVERLQPHWHDTVLLVVSDHEQEAVDQNQPELYSQQLLDNAGLSGYCHDEGAVALVVNGEGATSVRELPQIDGAIDLDKDVCLMWSQPGRVFGQGKKNRLGQHGSPRTMTQVATVAGGHPLVAGIACSLNQPHISGMQWAPTIARCFDLCMPHATGRALI
ncbi:MAG: alkaline phosphatase family protein [Pseudomonadota bacterium]